MTKQRDFKAKVRERAKQTGESYSTARAKMLAQRPPMSPAAETEIRTEKRSRMGWSIAEAMWVDKQAREGAPCVKEPFATRASEEELAFGFVECTLPNPSRMFRESFRVRAVAVEFFDGLEGPLVAFKLTSGGYGIRPRQMHSIDIEDAATLHELELCFANALRRAPSLVAPAHDPYPDYGGPGKPLEELRELAASLPQGHTVLVPADDPDGGPYSWPMVVEDAQRVPTLCESGWRRFPIDLDSA